MIRACIIGTGSYVPTNVVTNEQLVGYLGIDKTSGWLEDKFGIRERRLAFDLATGQRLADCSNVLLAEKACRQALEDANLHGYEIDHLFLVTCTPDKLHFMADVIELSRRLGLHRTARVDQIDTGCAGLAKAFDDATAYMEAGRSKRVLVVAANLPSAFFVELRRYVDQKAWFSPAIFGDGAGALVLEAQEKGVRGISQVFYEVDGASPLIDYPGGGAAEPTIAGNVPRHLYSMDARQVGEMFPVAMQRNMAKLNGAGSYPFNRHSRVYLHQANGNLVRGFATAMQIEMSRVPINIDRYGNTSAASTLIMLDEDRRSATVKHDDEVLFLWVGAGMMYGGAIVRL